MKFFIDTADVKEIAAATELGLVDGVTTNPSLVAKSGRNFHDVLKDIISLVDGPISAEVVATEASAMIDEAEPLAKLDPDKIVIKLPLTEEGLKATKVLSQRGLKTNLTLIFSPLQALLAAKAGATYITFHPEASEHIDRTLQLIQGEGCKAGLVFNPATPLSYLDYVIDKVDMILLMSVNPGFGGQKFIPSALDKLRQARTIIDDSGREIRLEIDGGVKVDNIGEIAAAGADTFVAGSAIFGSDDYAATIAAMKENIAKAT